MRALRNSACELADRGWHIIPIRSRHKAPHRLVPHGKDDASNDLAVVLGWWKKAPDANVGVVCNPSGLVVLDVDDRNDGFASLSRLEGEWGKLPITVSVVSGGGGAHFYFKHPGGEFRGTLGEGIDVKDHGYVLAPPSLHPDGGRYEWDEDPDETEVAPLPPTWLENVSFDTSLKVSSRSPEQEHDDPIRRIAAADYIARLTGREMARGGLFQCPWHAGGQEWEPSLKVQDSVWSCHGCPPILGKRALGGNIIDFAGLLAGYAIPLRGPDYLDVRERLRKVFHC